jgi:hypothetical protein
MYRAEQAGHMTCTRPRSSRRFSPCNAGARRYSVVAEARPGKPTFIPVTLALPATVTPAPEAAGKADVPPVSPPPAAGREPAAEHRIEIALGNGRVMRIGAGVDIDSLRRILDAAEGR